MAATATQAPSGPDPAAVGVQWDLSDLFAGPDDPRLWQALDTAQADATAFAARYRGTINVPDGPPPDLLLAALQTFEDLHERSGRIGSYVHLLFDSDTRNEAARDLQQKVQQRLTEQRN